MLTNWHFYTFSSDEASADCTLNLPLAFVTEVFSLHGTSGGDNQFLIKADKEILCFSETYEDHLDWIKAIKDAVETVRNPYNLK